MAKKNDLLEPEQLREALGISEATYYRWLREGRLKGVKVGRRWRFPKTLLDDLREDPERAHEREQALKHAVETCADLLARAKVKPKEVAAMLETANSDAEAVAGMLIRHALQRHAAELHLEPTADGLSIRERVDGILRPLDQPLPRGAQEEVVAAFKRMAGFDLTVTGLPQDARFFHEHEGRKVNLFCTSFPTALGEALTLRILDPAAVTLSFGKSGFSKRLQTAVRTAIQPASGVFIINGPTGSGKTTTAYSLLSELNRPGVKVMTIEDPVEFLIDGVLQAPLRAPLTISSAMKVMLRSSMDIGYVCELRDAETIKLLFQMGATGHKMISCMHAPDAAGALGRVLDAAGLPNQLIAENLLGILNQRLVPMSCPHCRRLEPMSKADARRLGVEPFKVAVNKGCDECGGTGVKGRTAVGELLTVTPGLRKALLGGVKDPEELRKAMPANWPDLRSDLLERLKAGDFHVEHAIAVLNL